ncbi:type IV pilus assembly protein PilC [Butyrivibrio hungatei DSM 14810]|uniref:Type IV pilus assembly protein PilC n=1 Tax=Butyrivibrio hungatei DSM 14810 TaxID=1121132 RepID=A0A1M7RS44_9FIRM|nr:type II secretion system F family protein [Butyrivibrio hungatei]SHN48942.1 type IV pilus assembly protein PilC [Butyrivibrio hungatei DSM 14810]
MKKEIAKKLNNYEIASFCRQMALLMKAGITPSDGIDILMEEQNDPAARKILSSISQVLTSGEKFHVALNMSGVFPDYVIHMVTIGEESGNIDVVMDSLADYYEREDSIQANIKNAVSYPLIMVFMMLIVILVLVIKVLPIFEQVFAQLGTNMSGFSQSLLNAGNILSKYSIVFVGILVLLALLFFYYSYTTGGKKAFGRLMDKFRPTKKLLEELESERFASGMVLTLSSGMDTYESLSLVKRLVETDAMKKKIETCSTLLLDGDSFPEALEKSKIFTSFYSQMVAVGFKSGSMDKAMKQIAERFEHETERKIFSLISVLEPTLVIIMSIIVGMILLSVILPLMGIMSTIG